MLTIAEIAKRLNIPESTARFYRDRFEMYIPSVGSGRQKRYRPEALEVVRYIADAFKRNEPQQEIEDALSRMFAVNVEPDETTAITTAAAQQQAPVLISAEQMAAAFGQIAAALETMATQKEEIAELRHHIADLEAQQQTQREASDAINRRIEQTDQLLLELRSSRKKGWWPFGR